MLDLKSTTFLLMSSGWTLNTPTASGNSTKKCTFYLYFLILYDLFVSSVATVVPLTVTVSFCNKNSGCLFTVAKQNFFSTRVFNAVHICRYFTWDKISFPNPSEMISNLSAVGRKMVAIVDPHIRRDNEYYVYKEAVDGGHLVLNSNGAVYEGWCWPGT